MRITTLIATSGKSGLSRFPVAKASLDECKSDNGEGLDESKLRRALSCDGIMFSSKDNLPVLAFGIEFLRQIRSVVERCTADEGPREPGAEQRERRCQRRMDTGRTAFVRVDVTWTGGHIRVRLGSANPRDVVGSAQVCADIYAEMCSRVLVYMQDVFMDRRKLGIELVEGPGCDGFFDRARKMNDWFDRRDAAKSKVDAANARRRSCGFMVAGFCTPSHPGCRCYRNGRCEPAELPEELRDPKEVFG